MGEVKLLNSFKDRYTTAQMVASDVKEGIEKNKIPLSNDAMAIGELLECLINKLNR